MVAARRSLFRRDRRSAFFARLILVLTGVVLLNGVGLAQRCSAELAGVLERSTTPEHVSGVEGVAVMRAAIELLEPALPRMRLGSPPGVGPGDPGYDDALYLYERNLLPEGWRPDALARPVWQEMARRLLAWYRLDPVVVGRAFSIWPRRRSGRRRSWPSIRTIAMRWPSGR
jgi:hypothetical protein